MFRSLPLLTDFGEKGKKAYLNDSDHWPNARQVSLIPAFIRRRIAHRPQLFKIIDNIGWLFLDNFLRMGAGLLVGVWIGRYLGPEQFGLLNYATAFVGLFSAFAALGLQSIVVRDIVRQPETTELTLGSAAVLQLVGGLVAYLLISCSIALLRPNDTQARIVVAILAGTMLFKACDIAVYWFESQVQSKYTVWVQNGVFIVVTVIKVGLILGHAPLTAFVWATLAEAALVGLALLAVMTKFGHGPTKLRATVARAKGLLIDSWPLILSAMAVSVYMKIDQIMLGQILGDEAVGIYSAAVRISEVWYFIPMAIAASVFPSILEAKKRSEAEYIATLQRLYDLMVAISVAVALPMTFLATPIAGFLFGESYLKAGPVLAIHIWGSIFIFLGVVSGQWFLAENRQILALKRTIIGAAANIGLNIFLIPRFQEIGAAAATVIAQAMAAFLSDALQRETHGMFFMKAKSLLIVSFFGRSASYFGRRNTPKN